MKNIIYLTLIFSVITASAYSQNIKVKGNYSQQKGEFDWEYIFMDEIIFKLNDNDIKISKQYDYQNWKIEKNNETTGKIQELKNERAGLYWKIDYNNETIRIENEYLPTDSWDDNRLFYMIHNSDTLWITCWEPDCNSEYEMRYTNNEKKKAIASATTNKPCGKGKWYIDFSRKASKLSGIEKVAFIFITAANNTIRNDERYRWEQEN